MKTFKEICHENGVEKYSSVVATVSKCDEVGTYAIIDGTEGLETFYHGGTQDIGCKVLLSIDGISENLRRIYSTLEHSYADDRAA